MSGTIATFIGEELSKIKEKIWAQNISQPMLVPWIYGVYQINKNPI
jgi:hypothetical protein